MFVLAADALIKWRNMPRSGKKRKITSQRMHAEMEQKAGLIDQLAQFDDFKHTILPALIGHVKKGKTAPELRKIALSVIQAKQISNAIKAEKITDSIAACKDILDREEGRAIERKAIMHKHQDLPDDQLDALILSKMKDVSQT